MSAKRPKTIFLSGDTDKAFEYLKGLKKEWYPDGLSGEWEEYDPANARSKGADIELLLESICYPPLNECYRTFVLKTPGDNAKTRQSLIALAKTIPDDTTLIVWDTHGLEDGKKTASPTWEEVRKVFQLTGKMVDTGKPLKKLSDVSQIAWVVKAGEESGLAIPKDCAELLLELFDRNRAMIQSEVENLALMSDSVVEKSTIIENAMPIQKDYPIYQFYSAFNSGSYRATMSSAQELIERGFKVDILLGFVVKQARWQVVIADAIRKRKDPRAFSSKISRMNHLESRAFLESDKSINKRLLLKSPADMEEDDWPKKENPPSVFAIGEMVKFIEGTMPRIIPPDEKDKKGAVYEQLMRRYVTLLEGYGELRVCKSDDKESCFARIIRRVTF